MKNKQIKETNIIKPNPKLFKKSMVGRNSFKPLVHKNGQTFDDIDYLELLGRRCIEIDKANENSRIPPNYGEGIDPQCVALSKEIVKGIDNGFTKKELLEYLNNSLIIE